MLRSRLGGALLRVLRAHGSSSLTARSVEPWRVVEFRSLAPRLFQHSEATASSLVSDSLIDQHFIEHDLEAPLKPPDSDEVVQSSVEAIWSKAKGSRDVVAAVKSWVAEGNVLSREIVNGLLVRLAARRQHLVAYLLSRWVEKEKPFELSDQDSLLLLHFAACQKKEDKARAAFNRLVQKTELAYNRVLKAYAEANWSQTAERLFKEMKEEQLLTTTEPYNLMMAMYLRLAEFEQAKQLFVELESSGLAPNTTTFKMLYDSKEALGMEGIEAKVDQFLEAGQSGDDKLKGQAWRDTIRLYGAFGRLSDVQRLWETKSAGAAYVPDIYYCAAAEAFAAAGDMNKFVELCKETETRNQKIRAEQAKTMISVYAARGELEQADAILEKTKEMGHKHCCNSYEALCAGYLRKGELSKALDKLQSLVKAVNVKDSNKPVFTTVLAVMETLAAAGCVDGAELVMNVLREARYKMDIRLYNALLRAYVVSGTAAGRRELEARLNSAGVLLDDETKKLLEEIAELEKKDYRSSC